MDKEIVPINTIKARGIVKDYQHYDELFSTEFLSQFWNCNKEKVEKKLKPTDKNKQHDPNKGVA